MFYVELLLLLLIQPKLVAFILSVKIHLQRKIQNDNLSRYFNSFYDLMRSNNFCLNNVTKIMKKAVDRNSGFCKLWLKLIFRALEHVFNGSIGKYSRKKLLLHQMRYYFLCKISTYLFVNPISVCICANNACICCCMICYY